MGAESTRARRLPCAAFDEMRKTYGTIERYFADGLGITEPEQQKLKALYLK